MRLELGDLLSCNRFISRSGKSSLWQESLVVFGAMPSWQLQSNVVTSNAAIAACEKASEWHLALLLDAQDVIGYNASMSACEKGFQWPIALELFETLLSRRLRASIISHTAALSACEKAGPWPLALQLFRRMLRSSRPDGISLNAAISSLRPRWQAAAWVFELMAQRSLQRDVVSHSALMSAGAVGRWPLALVLLEKLQRPNVVTVNAALEACAVGRQEAFHELLELMKGLRLEASCVTYRAQMGCEEALGRWAGALQVFSDMAQAQVASTAITYCSAMSACEARDIWQRALELFWRMGVERDVFCYGSALSSAEKGLRWQEGLHLASSMHGHRVRRSLVSFNAMLSCAEKGLRWSEALRLLGSMAASKLRADGISCNAALAACVRGRQPFRASRLFETMPKPDAIAYDLLLTAVEPWEAVKLLAALPQVTLKALKGKENGRREPFSTAFLRAESPTTFYRPVPWPRDVPQEQAGSERASCGSPTAAVWHPKSLAHHDI